MPSTISSVMRKGTRSGTGSSLPLQNAQLKQNKPGYVKTNLFKGYSKINVYDFPTVVIHENIRSMTVSESQNMTNDRCRRNAANVVQTGREPGYRSLVFLRKEVPHHRAEFPLSLEENWSKHCGIAFVFGVRRGYDIMDVFWF